MANAAVPATKKKRCSVRVRRMVASRSLLILLYRSSCLL
jgi:hypothetical protein